MQRTLAAFAKVFIADGSLVRLHPNLQHDYPSVWTNHTKAGAKLHVTIDGASRTPEILRIVPGSKHDVTLLNVGPWCKGALLVFDLAYYQGKLFRQILDHGGHFLCRAKKDANFVILAAKKSRWVGLKHKPAPTFPSERWTIVMRSVAPQLWALLLGPPRARVTLESRLWLVLQREAPDPNRSRMLLLERAQSGLLQHDLAAA